MSKRQNLLAVWQQIPVANRTVEVNTKTGFSLTAGSYAVRASSTQTAEIGLLTAASNTAAISSVTTTRAVAYYGGNDADTDNATQQAKIVLTNATTVTGARATATGNVYVRFTVLELF